MQLRTIFPCAALVLACSATASPTGTTDGTAGAGSTGGSTSGSGGTSGTTGSTGSSATIPDLYTAFGNGVTVAVDGNDIVLTTTDLPDHKSPYYGVGNAKYEAYNGTGTFQINPSLIRAQHIVFRIPKTPTKLSTPSPTPLGPIGIALNGVPIFNQYAANNQPLTFEIVSFDQYNGHPQMSGQYHYHAEPLYITAAKGKDTLIGVLLDGYPVYGPMENGRLVTAADLDAAHGHTGATKEFPQGIYHYHTTAGAPYINGSGFAGAPGTVSQ